jgi:ribose transport system permease protein
VTREAVEGTGIGRGGRAGRWLRGQLRNIAPFITLLFLVVFFSLASPSFATLGNLNNILTQISITGIMAAGLTFVILCAEIDLSVASVANATGIIVAFFTLQDASVGIANLPLAGYLAIPLALASCLVLGVVTAFGITRIGIPSFIMTLAMARSPMPCRPSSPRWAAARSGRCPGLLLLRRSSSALAMSS